MKKILWYINKIDQNKRHLTARSFIIVGILLAYSPYWITLFLDSESDVKISGNIVSIGWWVLAPGLILHYLNVWLNYKADLGSSNTSK